MDRRFTRLMPHDQRSQKPQRIRTQTNPCGHCPRRSLEHRCYRNPGRLSWVITVVLRLSAAGRPEVAPPLPPHYQDSIGERQDTPSQRGHREHFNNRVIMFITHRFTCRRGAKGNPHPKTGSLPRRRRYRTRCSTTASRSLPSEQVAPSRSDGAGAS